MQRMRAQCGEGKIGCVFWILLVLLFGYVAAKVVPVKIAAMELEDHMKDLAMYQPRKGRDYFEREIFNKARDLKLDVERKNIKVKKQKEHVLMTVELTVPIEILSYTHNWDIKIVVDRDIFLI